MKRGCILFDWGDTLMRNIPGESGKMVTWSRVEVIPGAASTLAALKAGWLLGIATNAAASDEEDIRAALRRGGIDAYFDRVYCYRRIGQRKPSPAFFTYILNDLGMKPEQVIMVGDDLENDVRGALRAGLRGVWFAEDVRATGQPLYSLEPVVTIRDLSALPAAIEAAGWAAGMGKA